MRWLDLGEFKQTLSMSCIHYTCFQYRPHVFAGKAPSPSLCRLISWKD